MIELLDHLVYAVPDLAAGVAEFTARTGVRPAPGGRHDGRGTANALVGLGPTSYLELIGPDPDQPEHAGPRPFGVAADVPARLATWAIHPDHLEARVAAARAIGFDPGELAEMSRRAPDGELLSWRLTLGDDAEPLAPFLIDWGATPPPPTRALPPCRLVDLRARHPNPPRLQNILDALGTSLVIEPGPEPVLMATLDTPRGPVTL